MTSDPDRAFFGHPKGLATLFFTEMWERFSYYGMRAFLIFYLAAPEDLGGKGMFVLNKAGEQEPSGAAGAIVGVFGASVYLLSLPGGWIADRFIGQRKGVMIGGFGIAAGNALLAIPGTGDLFYVGLVLIALGTGFLKPNVSTIVGQLYRPDDLRRDAGYTIYYMGINIGATAAPIACGILAQDPQFRAFLADSGINPNYCWNFAFGAAAIGMVGGLISYSAGQRALGDAGLHPTIPDDPVRAERDRNILKVIIGALVALAVIVAATAPSKKTITDAMGVGLGLGSIALFYGLYRSARDASERRRIIAMVPLFVGAIGFFGIFEQSPTTLNIYAESHTEREFLGLNIPASFYQSVNGFFIVALAPLFAWIWVKLARARKEPTSVNKFAIGMAILALSFVVMLPSLASIDAGQRVSPMYLIMLYLLYTCAELCISPVGLSSMSKLAPQRLAGMVMGTWFLGTSIGIYLAGRASEISEVRGFRFLFVFLIVCSLVMSAALFLVAPMIRRMMGKEATATSEPAELPVAIAKEIPKDKKN
ncbi:MAG: oligopeptide:H+ symporter [Deltaproteobacteria bacterium]|nr:oligopeptide:H+ symporter [Deltaproteobacteria bacterium]